MNLYILILALILIFCFNLFISKFVFSPICLILLSYLLSCILIVPNVDAWNVNLSNLTIKIVVLGLIGFVVGYILGIIFTKKRIKEINEFKFIKLSNFSKLLLICFQFLTIILNIYFVSKIVGNFSIFNFGEAIGQYRKLSAYSEELVSIPGFVSQMVRICSIIFYYLTYIFINNSFYNKKNPNHSKEKNISFIYFISSITHIILSLLSGGRYNIVTAVLGVVTMFTIMSAKDKEKIEQSFSIKMYFKIIVVFLIVILLFSGLRSSVGRTSESNTFAYISSYFGGSVPLLNDYLNDNYIPNSTEFGYNTFFPVYRLLNKFGFTTDYRRSNFEFSQSGTLSGNVYTAFFPMYLDFGIIGVIILQILAGFIWYKIYNKVYKKNRFDFISIIISIIYCLHMNALYLHSFNEGFFSAIFAQTFILEVMYTIVLYFIIFKLKIKFK